MSPSSAATAVLFKPSESRRLYLRLGIFALIAAAVSICKSLPILLGLGLAGLAHIFFLKEPRRALRLVLAVAITTASFAAFSILLNGYTQSALLISLRWIVAGTWLIQLGQAIRWIDVGNLLARLGAEEWFLTFADSTIQQGLLLLATFTRRLEVSTLRSGLPLTRLGLQTYSMIIAGGTADAFDRMVSLEEAKILRSSQSFANPLRLQLARHMKVEISLMKLGLTKKTGPTLSNTKQILQDVSLNLNSGEWVAVLGASGTGKTSLLRVISGLEQNTEGTLVRSGSVVSSNKLSQRVDPSVGFLFQNPYDQILGSTPDLDLKFGISKDTKGESHAIQCIERQSMLSKLGLVAIKDSSASVLSFGEAKRLALAGCLLRNPSLLLCDEPTAGLDPANQARLLEAIRDYRKRRPLTVIWATHDFFSLPKEIERVVLMKDGKIVFDGSREQALTEERLKDASLIV